MKVRLSVIVITCLTAIGCGSGNKSNNGNNTQPPVSPVLNSIQITSASTTVPLGATESLTATGTYSDGNTHDLSDKVTWSSSAQNIATVSALGDITALALGSVVVTATSGSISSTLDLTVGPPALSKIDVSPSAPSTPANTTQQLTAVGRYTDGTAREVNDLVTWSSSDESKVTISANGVAAALATGAPTVTATAGTISGSATMTVSAAQLVRIALLPYQPVTGVGVLQQFVVLGTFDDYSTHQLLSASWNSSQPGVASIDTTGLLTPVQAGASTITATVGSLSNTTGLTVLPATLTAIFITPSSASVAGGTDQQLKAEGLLSPDGGLVELPVLDWKSSDTSIATVDSTGRVVAGATGTATISATVAGITGSTTLNVTGATLQSIVLAPAAPSVPVLSLKRLYAIGTFSDGTTQDLSNVVAWSTNDLNKVMVNHHGLASTNATGTARISAALGDSFGSSTFTISSLTVSSVAVQPASISIPRGVKQQYTLLSTLSDGTTVSLDAPHWYTSPITMATANPPGLVIARTPAIGKVYGETCCKTAYTQLTVTNAKATSVDIVADTFSIPNGAVQSLKAIATFDDNSQADVSNAVHWTSSDTIHALIDGQGFLTAALKGTAPVTLSVSATFGPVDGNPQTVSEMKTITIIPGDLLGLTISGPAGPILLGNTVELSLSGNFSDGMSRLVRDVTWQSSDPNVAVVLASGIVISTGKGTAVITAKASGFTTTTSLTIQ